MPHSADRLLRRGVLAVLVLGMVGSTVELLLLGHVEDPNQFIPLVLFATALALLAWMGAARSTLAVRVFQATMALFIASGLLGVWLHFQANREFQLEVDPSAAGWPLVLKVLRAKAPPALAPGMMVQFGLLGLAYTYRHPHLEPPERDEWS